MSILDVTVTINGVDYTGDTLGQVRVVRGRDNILAAPQAGYCNVRLIDKTGAGFPITVTDNIRITIENSAGPVDLFTGTISDWNTELYGVRTGTFATWSIIGSGPLALANRRQVLFSGAVQEGDGDRAYRILEAGLLQTWEEFRGTTWAAVGPTVTWETVDPGWDETLIERPGDYTVAALDPRDDGYNALGALSQTANSVGGYAFETGSGSVGYLSTYGRSALAANGYRELPSDQILVDSLRVQQQASDLVNRIEVTYGGGSVEDQDLDSIGRHGVRASVLSTILADQSAAEDRAADLLFDLAVPRAKLPEVQFALHTLDSADIDLLIDIDLNSPVKLNGLPVTLGPAAQLGFVEGLQYDLGSDRRFVRFLISDNALSLRSERWQDVDQTIAWEDVSATLEWAEARRVTV
jgi:hypothetical protein